MPSAPDEGGEAGSDTTSDETDDERMERQRQELMDRLAHPLDASEATPDPQPDAAPIPPVDVEPTDSVPEALVSASTPEPPPPAPPAKKPARLKLSYKNPSSVVREYMENLSKGGSFVKTSKPLAVGRQVTIEVRVPTIADDPIVIPGVVTWSSRDLDTLGPDEVPGMGIEYSVDDIARAALEARLVDLKS